MAMKSMCPTHTVEDAKSDYQSATKIGPFRFGAKAVYLPAFPGSQYLALEALNRAWVQRSALSPKGCCGAQLPVFVLRVQYNGQFFQNFTFDKEADAQQALTLLKEHSPQLLGAPDGVEPGRHIL